LPLETLRAAVEPLRQSLLTHPLYADLHGAQALRVFMEHHVFAVWDFMSLLKGLQQRLCCVAVPWLPIPPTLGSRLINEIVLGEETDDDGTGGYASHFDLYHRAMTRFNARTEPIDRFLGVLRSGCTVDAALRTAAVTSSIQQFVGQTFSELERGDLCRIAAAFTFGREDLLPEVFQRIVDELARRPDCDLEVFEYYLRRHIELDGGEHGPMAAQLMESLCGDEPTRWENATCAAVEALRSRLVLWDGIHQAIRATRASGE